MVWSSRTNVARDARAKVKVHPNYTLHMLNADFIKVCKYYNEVKPHRSLPNNCSPATMYFQLDKRIHRPLETVVNWDLWINTTTTRRVTKYNSIKFEGQGLTLPPGYAGLKVDLVLTGDQIEIYYKNTLLVSHPYDPDLIQERKKIFVRKINSTGSISWKGKKYTIDYKLRGKIVEIIQTQTENKLEIYYNTIKIKNIEL